MASIGPLTALSLATMMFCTLTTSGGAQTGGTIVKLPQDIVFKGGEGPPQTVVIYGDPTKPGLYVSL